ncbi:MAG: hypothetical protein ACOC58_02870 [Chloroflexota bacterium]
MNEQRFYRTNEVYRAAGIARNTLVRWLHSGRVAEPMQRDRNGWRLFSQDELDAIREEANRIEPYIPPG